MSRIDQPIAGYYTARLIRGGLRVPVRIWFGPPIIDGEEQDRSHRWCVEVDGRTCRADYSETGDYLGRIPLDAHEVWPYCAGHPITEREYAFLRRRATWAHDNDPEHPAANPRVEIDVRRLRPGW